MKLFIKKNISNYNENKFHELKVAQSFKLLKNFL